MLAQVEDPVGIADRGQAVGNHDGGAIREQPIKIALQGGFGGGIEEGSGFIHHQHRGIADRLQGIARHVRERFITQ